MPIGRWRSRSAAVGARVLKADMEQLVQNLLREAKKMFESDEYANQRQAMIEQIQRKQQEMMEALMEEAGRKAFRCA